MTRRLPVLKTQQRSALSYPDFFDWRAQNRTLEHLVSYHDSPFTLTGVARPVNVDGEVVSWDLLPTLGVNPELGRGFTAEEEKRGSRVVLISHALWVEQFGADKSILGRTVNLSGNPYTIIGIMPASFRFPVTSPRNGVWTTLAVDDDPSDPKPVITMRGAHFLNTIGRMKPGVTVTQVDQELKNIAGNLAKQYPNTNSRHDSARVVTELAALIGDTRVALMIVLGAVAVVLLIACANIANLLLARMRERQREIAMRAALGAGRQRIIRQLLVESLVLSTVGGLAGCGLAFVATPAMLSLIGDSVPRAANAGVDLRVLSFAILLSFVAGLIFGIVPAITASKTDLVTSLKESGRTETSHRDWLRSSLIVAQVALGLVLTVGAGLLITSFVNLLHTKEGFNPDHLLTFFFELPDSQYKQKRGEFYRNYFERVRAIPGVQSAGGVLVLPMTYNVVTISFVDPEHPVPEAQEPSADLTPVSPGYFGTMQIPLLEGRDFSDRDDKNAPQVMIVNQAFAQKFFPGENVIGKKLKPGAGSGDPKGPPWREIVGVVGNIRMQATQREMKAAMYLPAAQMNAWCCLYTVVRTSVEPRSLEPTMRQLVSSLDPDIPVTEVHTMQEQMFSELSQPRFAMVLLGRFRRTGDRAHHRWPLRRHDVLGSTPHARDRRPHGFGRAAWHGAEDGAARCRHPAGDGHCRGRGRFAAFGFGVEKHVVRDGIAQPACADAGLCCRGAGGPDRGLHSRISCRVDRTDAGPAQRIRASLDFALVGFFIATKTRGGAAPPRTRFRRSSRTTRVPGSAWHWRPSLGGAHSFSSLSTPTAELLTPGPWSAAQPSRCEARDYWRVPLVKLREQGRFRTFSIRAPMRSSLAEIWAAIHFLSSSVSMAILYYFLIENPHPNKPGSDGEPSRSFGREPAVAVSLISASVLKSMLYGTGSRNPVVLMLVCAAVALAGLIAAYIPAFRAASIEPMQALRSE